MCYVYLRSIDSFVRTCLFRLHSVSLAGISSSLTCLQMCDVLISSPENQARSLLVITTMFGELSFYRYQQMGTARSVEETLHGVLALSLWCLRKTSKCTRAARLVSPQTPVTCILSVRPRRPGCRSPSTKLVQSRGDSAHKGSKYDSEQRQWAGSLSPTSTGKSMPLAREQSADTSSIEATTVAPP